MCPSLAECLAEEEITNRLYASQIQTGGVYRMKFTESDGIVPKNIGDNGRNKFFVVLKADAEYFYGCLLINSNVNENALSKEAQLIQYPILARKYKDVFTTPISYVNCSYIHPIPISRIKNATFKCILDYEDLDYIMSSIKSGILIPKAVLKRFNLI
jgi:hypothetical protein